MRFACIAASVLALAACSSAQGGGTGGASGSEASGSSASASAGSGGASGDTWSNFAEGFFATYCVECHDANDPSTPPRDYTKYADVKTDAPTIRCGVAPVKLTTGCDASFPPPKQFPISDAKGTNPKPSDAERDRLVLWIQAGLPQ
jgi:hypothetical protein